MAGALAATIPAVTIGLKNEGFRNSLLQRFATSLDGELQADVLSVALDKKSINISCRNLKGSLLNNALSARIPDIRIRVTYVDLLQGSFFPNTIQATSPQINYTLKPAPAASRPEKTNWSKEFNALLEKILGKDAHIDIKGGTLSLASTTLSKVFILTTPGNSSTKLKMRTDILHAGSVIPLDITGTYKKPPAGTFTYEFDIKTVSVPLTLVPSLPDFFFSGGTAGFTGKLSGSRQDINLDGNILIDNLDMTVGWTSEDGPIRRLKPYRLTHCALAIQGGLQGRKIDFPTLDLQSENFHLQGALLLDFTNITNPFMDLRLKSDEMAVATLKMLLPDPLINLWTTQTIFPRFENGTARISNFILAGTTGEIARLSEPENNHCLSWSGSLHDVDAFYNDHKPLARVHSVNLSMHGDLLKITDISGTSGESTLTRGDISITKLYEPSLTVMTDAKGVFSLAWLSRLLKDGLLGEGLQQAATRVSSISGQVDGQVLFSFSKADEFNLQSLQGTGSTSQMVLGLDNMLYPIKMQKAEFSLSYPGTCVVRGNGSCGKSTFDGSMNLIEMNKKKQFKLNIRPNLVEVKKIFAANQVIQSLAPCIATLPLQAYITLEKRTVAINGILDVSKSIPAGDSSTCKKIILENQLEKVNFELYYDNNNLNVKKISLLTKDGNLQAKGIVKQKENAPGRIKKLTVQAADFPVQALSIIMEEPNRYLNGSLTAKLDGTDLSLDKIWQTLNGGLQLHGWHGSFISPPLTINNLNISAVLDNGMITVKGNNILLADFNPKSPLTFKADLQKKDLWNGSVRLHGDYLNLTTMPSMFKQVKKDSFKRLPIGKIRILSGAERVKYRNISFSPLLAQVFITADKIIIAKSLLQLGDDFIWHTGYQQDNDIIYQTYYKIEKKPVDTVLSLLAIDHDGISGYLDSEGNIIAKVTPEKNILQSVAGSLYFKARDGTLESSSVLVKILDLISLENIFEKQEIMSWKNTFNYNQISGRFDIADGVFTTNSLIMDASAFDIFGEGNVDMLDETIDMKIKLAPFGTINKLFSSIPYLGYILTGKTKSLFDYSFSVTGKTKDPAVEYSPLANSVDSLTGYVKRLVSGKQEIQQEINANLKEDMVRKKSFILRMNRELAPLREVKEQTVPSKEFHK